MNQLSRNECKAALEQIIGDCVYHALGLKETLTDERAALEAQDTEALDALLSEKRRLLSELENLEARRGELSVASGFDRDPESMQQVARWCDEDAVIENMWQHFLDIARTCNQLNMTNGAIIHLRRHHTTHALSLLRSGKFNNGTYGPGGREVATVLNRTLAEA